MHDEGTTCQRQPDSMHIGLLRTWNMHGMQVVDAHQLVCASSKGVGRREDESNFISWIHPSLEGDGGEDAGLFGLLARDLGINASPIIC